MNGYQAQRQESPINEQPFVCCPDGAAYFTTCNEDALILRKADEKKQSRWLLHRLQDRLKLQWTGPCSGEAETVELLAALEAAFSRHPDIARLDLYAPVREGEELLRSGVLIKGEDNYPSAYAELFWQQARLWLASPQPQVFPLRYILTQGRRHPLRPPKSSGVVYRRYIPWINRTLSFRTVEIKQDLEQFNRWMNDPVVAEFWQEEGGLDKHRAYLQNIAEDPRALGLIGCFDGEPFGYFEVYWAKEDRIAPFYDADDFDRGWHVLIGEPKFRGKPFVAAWLPSISHYLFLDDCRTQRIVIEPRYDNHKMIRNLAQCGYANIKEFDFPHKRAMLGMLLRERFFAERLWVPRSEATAHPSSQLLSQAPHHAHS